MYYLLIYCFLATEEKLQEVRTKTEFSELVLPELAGVFGPESTWNPFQFMMRVFTSIADRVRDGNGKQVNCRSCNRTYKRSEQDFSELVLPELAGVFGSESSWLINHSL